MPNQLRKPKGPHKPKPEPPRPQLDIKVTHAEGPLGGLDPRRLDQRAILELMRIAAGIDYKQLAGLTGILRYRIIRILQGEYKEPRTDDVKRILEVLWEHLPKRRPQQAIRHLGHRSFLTLEEAAEQLSVSKRVMRRMCQRRPELGAIQVGRALRIPADAFDDFIIGGRPPVDGDLDTFTMKDLQQILRVPYHTIRWIVRTGQVRTFERGSGRRKLRIPREDVIRLLHEGTGPVGERGPHRPSKRVLVS